MKKYIALLRSINVGGNNKIKMADLRALLERRGLSSVSTYIQSGNVLFRSEKRLVELEQIIANSILDEYGFDVPVLVRQASDFEKIIARNPFVNADTSVLCVTLLGSKPSKKLVAAIPNIGSGADEYVVVNDTVYINCPDGRARTKLTIGFFEKHLGVKATARNWNSINKLAELAKKL